MKKIIKFISGCCMAIIGLCSGHVWAQNADSWPENMSDNIINSLMYQSVFRDLGEPVVTFTIRHSQANITTIGVHPPRNHRYSYLIRFPENISMMMRSQNKINIYNYVVVGNEARIDGLPLNIQTATNEVDYKLGRTSNMGPTIKAKLKVEMKLRLKIYIDQMYSAYQEAMKDDRSGLLTPIGTGATNSGSNTPTSGGSSNNGGGGRSNGGPSSVPGSSGSSGGLFGMGTTNPRQYP